MHSECRKMPNFASIQPSTPIEAGLKLPAHQGLWESSPKSTVFHLNFQKEFQCNNCIHNAGKCTISHLDLENFPGVAPRTPFGEGHNVLYQGLWEFSPKSTMTMIHYDLEFTKKNSVEQMHSECRKMHHFAS